MGKSLTDLHPYLESLATALIKQCADMGIRVVITDTLRTPEEQTTRYNSGRTNTDPIITYKKADCSLHQYGLAFDFAVYNVSHFITDEDRLYHVVGRVGKDLGLSWGGDSRRPCDINHFSWSGGLFLNELKKGNIPNRDGSIRKRPHTKYKTKYDTIVRSQASCLSKRVGVIPKDTLLKVFNNEGLWAEIEFNGRRAFVSNINLK